MRGILVALGAGVGAPARYLVDKYIKQTHKSFIPWETLLINILGSFVLGFVIKSGGNTALIFGTGFAGAFTTWSTFAVETHELFDNKNHRMAFAYVGFTLVLGIAAAALGNAL